MAGACRGAECLPRRGFGRAAAAGAPRNVHGPRGRSRRPYGGRPPRDRCGVPDLHPAGGRRRPEQVRRRGPGLCLAPRRPRWRDPRSVRLRSQRRRPDLRGHTLHAARAHRRPVGRHDAPVPDGCRGCQASCPGQRPGRHLPAERAGGAARLGPAFAARELACCAGRLRVSRAGQAQGPARRQRLHGPGDRAPAPARALRGRHLDARRLRGRGLQALLLGWRREVRACGAEGRSGLCPAPPPALPRVQGH
mmetsp:Transcript_1659/g.3980  ORF Transcript_1659/g.3980 Transcript_1659/m.3980 type:complete len:250 (-) Transcript_1659:655-1404(-)